MISAGKSGVAFQRSGFDESLIAGAKFSLNSKFISIIEEILTSGLGICDQ